MVQGERYIHSDRTKTKSTKNPKKDSPNVTVIFLLAFPQRVLGTGLWLPDLYTSCSHNTAKGDTGTGVKCRLSNQHQQ